MLVTECFLLRKCVNERERKKPGSESERKKEKRERKRKGGILKRCLLCSKVIQ